MGKTTTNTATLTGMMMKNSINGAVQSKNSKRSENQNVKSAIAFYRDILNRIIQFSAERFWDGFEIFWLMLNTVPGPKVGHGSTQCARNRTQSRYINSNCQGV